MIKIVFIDVDGTLKDGLSKIPKSIEEVITLCFDKEIILCLCTGRSIGTIQEDVNNLAIHNVIAGGGNYIRIGNNVIFKDSFDEVEVINFLGDKMSEECAFALETNHKIFMNQAAENIFLKMNKKYIVDMSLEEKQYYQENEKLVYRSNMNEFSSKEYPIHKICIWCKEEQFKDIAKHIPTHKVVQKNKWGDMYYHELVKVGCDKGSAIRKVQSYFSLTKEESMCFGNGKNDIDMFNACGCSIAMKDSDMELKRYATSICEKAQDDGIFKELKRRKVI